MKVVPRTRHQSNEKAGRDINDTVGRIGGGELLQVLTGYTIPGNVSEASLEGRRGGGGR